MAAIEQWAQLAASNDLAVPDGSPERHDRDQVNDISRTNMAALRTFFEDGEWLDLTLENQAEFTVSRAGVDRFLVIDGTGTDARSKFPVGRWVKVTGTASPTVAFGEVASTPVYAPPNTTVILKNIFDAAYASSDIPDTTVTKVECYWNATIRQAAFHSIGTTLAQAPSNIATIDQLGDGALLDQGAGNNFDADTVDGLHAAAFQLAAGGRNAIVNSSMAIWQRSQALTTPADGDLTADRMVVLAENPLWDVGLESTNLPSGYRSALKLTATGAVDKVGVLHIATGENSRQIIDNGTASFSYWVLCPTTTGIARIRAAILEWRGPGIEDVPTRDWVSVWGIEETDPSPVANWFVANTPVDDEHLANNSWVLVTVENVTINAAALNLGVFVWVEDKTYSIDDVVRMTGFNLIPGATAQTHAIRLRDEEMALCLPHYRSSYDYGVAAGTVTSIGRIEFPVPRAGSADTGEAVVDVRTPMPMFKTPDVTVYSPGVGTEARASHGAGSADVTAAAINVGVNGFTLQITGDPDDLQPAKIHYTAEAEM